MFKHTYSIGFAPKGKILETFTDLWVRFGIGKQELFFFLGVAQRSVYIQFTAVSIILHRGQKMISLNKTYFDA